jgi:hypothetical protein
MKLQKVILLSGQIVCLMLFGSLYAHSQDATMQFDCKQSFEYFAYGIQEEITEVDQLTVSWVSQYEMPITDTENRRLSYRQTRVLFSRTVNGNQEIWLRLSVSPNPYDEPVFGVYRVQDGSLTLIPRRLGDSFTMANELTVDNNGTIWATVNQFVFDRVLLVPGSNIFPTTFASLASFDDMTSEFVPVSVSPQVQFRSDLRSYNPRTQLILNSDGQLWVFFNNEDVYLLNTTTRTFTLTPSIQEIEGRFFRSLEPTLDGSAIVDLIPTSDVPSQQAPALPIEDTVFELSPNIGEIQNVPAPPIPLYPGLPRVIAYGS